MLYSRNYTTKHTELKNTNDIDEQVEQLKKDMQQAYQKSTQYINLTTTSGNGYLPTKFNQDQKQI